MHHHYRDITSRIDEAPSWWDENGVPRYGEFEPNASANIYARQVALLLIGCQGCGTEFRVCMTSGDYLDDKPLSERITDDTIHYGDPPNANCCPAGPTMNSVPRRVLEFWEDNPREGTTRRPEFEVDVDCGWDA